MKITSIRFENLHYQIDEGSDKKVILNGISGRWDSGCSIALRGVSGSGKTTLISIIAGLRNPTGGLVTYDSANSPQDAIGYLFQESLLIPLFSVVENVILKGLIRNENLEVARQEGMRLLEQVALADKATADPLTLSGGEQQRVAVARALYGAPSFVLLDEPTAHLDHQTKHALMALLMQLQQRYGYGMIIATHDDEVSAYMDTTITLIDGSMVTSSPIDGSPVTVDRSVCIKNH